MNDDKNEESRENIALTGELTGLSLSQLADFCSSVLIGIIKDSKEEQARLWLELEEDDRQWIARLYGKPSPSPPPT